MSYIKWVAVFLFLQGCIPQLKSSSIVREFLFTGVAQGTTYRIMYFAEDSTIGSFVFDSIFRKIDSSLSIYKPFSLISRFNAAADGIELDDHLGKVVKRSLQIYKSTRGISDITVYPLVASWGFGTEQQSQFPDSAMISGILPCVGSDKIFIRNNWLGKTKPCVRIDVNGIAQGYTVDVIADYLAKSGIRDYLVEVGGELRVSGHKFPGRELFRVGIESPPQNEFDDAVMKKIISFEKGAVTTSGNYRKYIDRGGRIVSHLMDPRTGYPFQNEMISVTVFAKDAITADGYDNAFMGMGISASFRFLQQHPEMQVYFIYHQIDGSVADTATAGFYKLIRPENPKVNEQQ